MPKFTFEQRAFVTGTVEAVTEAEGRKAFDAMLADAVLDGSDVFSLSLDDGESDLTEIDGASV